MSSCRRPAAARQTCRAQAAWRTGTGRCRPSTGLSDNDHTPRHSAYRSQFVAVAYPWHPLHGQHVRIYGRQGRAGRQILYIEVQPGLSREIPAWMCDAAVCATISVGSPRIGIDALTELRAVLDTHSAERSRGGSLNSSTTMGGSDETSFRQSTHARSRQRRKTSFAGRGTAGAAPGVGRPAPRSPRQRKQDDTGQAGGM